jgi:hypothetical protein
MLVALSSSKEIQAAHQICLRRLKTELPMQVSCTFSFRGGAATTSFYYNRDFWFANPYDLPNRYWFVFGIGTPGPRNNITLELNIPFEGISRQIQGLYAKDPKTNEIFFLHRGKIGGGRTGIGREEFLKCLNPSVIQVLEPNPDGKDRIADNIICIASLSSPSFLKSIAAFVNAVAKFKAATA